MKKQDRVIAMLDKFFTVDIQVKIDEKGIITGFQAMTTAGAGFILHHAGEMLEKPYNPFLYAGGIVAEVV